MVGGRHQRQRRQPTDWDEARKLPQSMEGVRIKYVLATQWRNNSDAYRIIDRTVVRDTKPSVQPDILTVPDHVQPPVTPGEGPVARHHFIPKNKFRPIFDYFTKTSINWLQDQGLGYNNAYNARFPGPEQHSLESFIQKIVWNPSNLVLGPNKFRFDDNGRANEAVLWASGLAGTNLNLLLEDATAGNLLQSSQALGQHFHLLRTANDLLEAIASHLSKLRQRFSPYPRMDQNPNALSGLVFEFLGCWTQVLVAGGFLIGTFADFTFDWWVDPTEARPRYNAHESLYLKALGFGGYSSIDIATRVEQMRAMPDYTERLIAARGMENLAQYVAGRH